ncbi:RNA polymerase sigma factor [Sinosporangium siamense]|uniref:RNA polymerase sigma factor n=1 Tax=Sinosporangium siamense TaxID=1367973 RepID=UPI0036D2F06C
MRTIRPPMPDVPGAPPDASIIEGSLHEPELFSSIFDRYYAAIHRYVSARLGPAAADDVAAETFLAAFDQRHRYDQAYPEAKAWLYGIATNLVGRHRRGEVRLYRALGRSTSPEETGGHDTEVTDRVAAQRLSPALAQGLAKLAKGDRDALLLVACAQLSYAETAQALGIPVGTVGSRISRARRSLRKTLGTTGQEVMNHG